MISNKISDKINCNDINNILILIQLDILDNKDILLSNKSAKKLLEYITKLEVRFYN